MNGSRSVNVTIYRSRVEDPDTSEYAHACVSVRAAAPGETVPELDQVVRFSLDDRVTWRDAEWYGDQWTEGTGTRAVNKRMAHLLMTEDNLPPSGTVQLYVRITDNPELPIIRAGAITIQ